MSDYKDVHVPIGAGRTIESFEAREVSRNLITEMRARIAAFEAELAVAREREAALAELLEWVVGDHNAPSDCFSTGPITGTPKDDLCPACAAVQYLKSNKLSTAILARVRREAKLEVLRKARERAVMTVQTLTQWAKCGSLDRDAVQTWLWRDVEDLDAAILAALAQAGEDA